MATDLRGMIKQLRILSPELNKRSDEATRVVNALRDFLNKELSLGISSEAFIRKADKEHDEYGTILDKCLSYERYDGKFDICIVFYISRSLDSDNVNKIVRPWNQCSRFDKLESISAIPDLLSGVHDAVKSAITATQGSITVIKEAMKEYGIEA